MAWNLTVGEQVYAPCSRVSGLQDYGVALYRTEVVEAEAKKVRVRLRDGQNSGWIGSSLIHRNVGILILNIGDFLSEASLLDPLAKSVAQYCRLIVPDDQIRSVRVRSIAELQKFWTQEQAAYSHIVWVGHGRNDALHFAVDGWVGGEALGKSLRQRGAPRKVYISLCCNTGYQAFGSAVSRTTICSDLVAPFHAVPGAIASQFCQTFLAYHLLEGRSVGVAFTNARKSVPGSVSFRLWRAGKLKATS